MKRTTSYNKLPQVTISYYKLPLIIISCLTIMLIPIDSSALMESPSYRIDYERLAPGGGVEGTDNYQMLESLGEFGAGAGVSDNYQAGAGEAYGIMAEVMPTPTLLSNGSYNSLNFRLNRGFEYANDSYLQFYLKFNDDPVFDSYANTGVASEQITLAGAAKKIAQRFQTGTTTDYIGGLDIYQTLGGNLAGDFTIETDSSGSPSGTSVGNGAVGVTLNGGTVTHVVLATSTALTATTTYWLIFTPTAGSGTFEGNTISANNEVKIYDGTSWNLSANVESIYFRVFDQLDDLKDNNNGQDFGSLTTGGRFGRGLIFDGSDDYVVIKDSPSLDAADTLTLEAWVKPDDALTSDEYIIYRANAYFLKLNSLTRAVGAVWNGVAWVTASSNTLIADGSTWSHLALTYDSTSGGTDEMKIYVNGIKQGVGDNAAAVPLASSQVYIGAGDEAGKDNTPENWFDGAIDETAFSSRAKRESEISREAQIANPADAEYAIAISSDNFATTNYIQADGTTGNAMVWQTYAGWGEGIGETVSGLSENTIYQIKVKARQGEFTETPWSLETSAQTAAVSLTVILSANTCAFGDLVRGTLSTCQTVITVDTNVDSGYQTVFSEDHGLQDSSGNIITDVADGAVDNGEEYGVRTSGSVNAQMSGQDYPITAAEQVLASSSGPAVSDQITVTYKIIVDTSTAAGDYSHTVTYVTTATY